MQCLALNVFKATCSSARRRLDTLDADSIRPSRDRHARHARRVDMLNNSMPRASIIEHQGQVGDCRSAWRSDRILYGTTFGESDMITTEDGITIWHVKKAIRCIGFHLVNTVNFCLPGSLARTLPSSAVGYDWCASCHVHSIPKRRAREHAETGVIRTPTSSPDHLGLYLFCFTLTTALMYIFSSRSSGDVTSRPGNTVKSTGWRTFGSSCLRSGCMLWESNSSPALGQV
jgi:hypothetical protein